MPTKGDQAAHCGKLQHRRQRKGLPQVNRRGLWPTRPVWDRRGLALGALGPRVRCRGPCEHPAREGPGGPEEAKRRRPCPPPPPKAAQGRSGRFRSVMCHASLCFVGRAPLVSWRHRRCGCRCRHERSPRPIHRDRSWLNVGGRHLVGATTTTGRRRGPGPAEQVSPIRRMQARPPP